MSHSVKDAPLPQSGTPADSVGGTPRSTRSSTEKKLKIKPNGIDFQTMAQQHGYVKARQLLSQASIKFQQEKIKQTEKDLNASKAPQRLKESLFLASTFGDFDSDSILDRIMKGNQSILMSEASQVEMLESIMKSAKGSASTSRGTGKTSNKGSEPITITAPSPSRANISGSSSKMSCKQTSENAEVEETGRTNTSSNKESGKEKNDVDESSPDEQNASKLLVRTGKHSTPFTLKDLMKSSNGGPDEKRLKFFEDDTLRHTLEGGNYDVLIPNQDATELPHGLGDTLNLQLAYTRRIICTRNLLRGILSYENPMLSMYHMRYLTSINLSFNKIATLPSDFGVLKSLVHLDMSYNYLSSLPDTIRELKSLETLNLASNSFAVLPDAFAYLDALHTLNLSSNLFADFPHTVVRLRALKSLKISINSLIHLAVPPPLLTPDDMWTKVIDRRTGKWINMNILTHEKIANVEKYNGAGIQRHKYLHVFQPEGSSNYRKRKIWLSINQIQEWTTDTDPTNGLTFYRNNVSSETQWEMPTSLDTIGHLSTLEEFEVKQNSIKAIPLSFVYCHTLRKIVFCKNRITGLPEMIGEMKRLEHLDLTTNELRTLPVSICECESLQVLILTDNHLVRLPHRLGFLPKLQRLDVCSNRLKTVAFSLGYCETLETFVATENPLEDPPIEEFVKGIDSLKWYLRSRYLIDERGMPPEMQFHHISVCNQITVLEPEFTAIVKQMIEASKRDGMLNLQLLGLKEIPPDVLKMKNLRRLKLDFNDTIELKEGFDPRLQSLITLSIRACKMTYLPDNVYIFESLKSLSIHENYFEHLPEGITELRTLTYLDASKNRLYHLPDGFEKLHKLTTLNLESNNLEELPPEIPKLKRLKTLNLAKNRISDCPDNICQLSSLKALNLEKNSLQCLPVSICHLNVVDLRVGHNLLQSLPPDMFAESLGQSIKWFSCCENNILELPWSITRIDPEGYVDADFNPYVSPPPYLLSEGLQVVQNYLHIRHVRRQLFDELISDEDFVISRSAMSPTAFEVLQDGTGFLTPDDLAEFDQAVDEYLNGEYYRCPATAEELVQSVTLLRENRETEIYLNILYTFLATIRKLFAEGDTRFSDASITTEERPWGRRSENCQVWCVSLLCLLRDAPPNPFQPEGRPSLFSLIDAALPPMAFPFTVDLLKDAIRLYESPYGQIADTEHVTYPSCDCIDDVRFKPKRHNPCAKVSVVLCKSIYVTEEANRREIEEDEFISRFTTIEDDIKIWLQTDEGRLSQDREIKRRKAVLKEEIELRGEMIDAQLLKLKRANDALHSVTKRKEQLEEGEPYESHGFKTMGDALQAVNEVNDEIARLENRITKLTDQLNQMKHDVAQDYEVFHKKTSLGIIQKYCVLNYNKHVGKHRFYALKYKLNRYWDGEDGAGFEEWQKSHSYAGDTTEMDLMMKELDKKEPPPGVLKREDSTNSIKSNTSKKSDASVASNATGASGKGPNIPDEYNFKETDDMERYHLYIYNRYRRERDDMFMGLLD